MTKNLRTILFSGMMGLALIFAMAFTSCKTEVQTVDVTGISISPSTLTLEEGKSRVVRATVTPDNATDKTVTWSVSDKKVLSLSATTGAYVTVKALKIGTATISAVCGDFDADLKVTVTEATAEEVITEPETTVNNSVVEGATNGTSVGTSGKSFVASSSSADDYTVLVWSDEFEGTALKSENWKYETGAGGWGNSESQNYTKSSENSEVKGGVLRITVKGDGTNAPTSARIKSQDLKYFKYGKLEARIKFDEGNLSWPAFWMLGQNMSEGVTWPYCGEIDIMEHINTDRTVMETLHWNVGGASTSTPYNHGGYGTHSPDYYGTKPPITKDDWHVYGLKWTENKIVMYVDDVDYFSFNLSGKDGFECFNNSFFFILNYAAGGQLVGKEWAPASAFAGVNWNMYVDYVRVYQDAAHEVDGVASIPVEDIAITGTKTVNVGSTTTLTATVTPANATDQTVTWTSSDTSIATVSSSGVVTGVKAGDVTITAKAGNKQKTVTVTVTNASVAVTSVSISGDSSVKVGKTITLTATVSPDNATDKTVTWSSGDTDVATVSSTGVVTGKKAGTATITATAGGKSGTKTITVSADTVAVTSVSVSGNSSVKVGKTITLTATVSPDNATEKTVSWTSSKTDVATVSSTGVVTGKKAGSATITATAGGKSVTKTITVLEESSSSIEAPLDGYSLVWHDEFDEADSDGTPLSSKWGYDIGIGYSACTDGKNPNNGNWGNGELQWYSDNDPDNTYVSDGTLKIVAKKESSNGMNYTSGRIVTRSIEGGQWKYGYIEMSAKIPNDAGVWPAFWMLDQDIYDGQGWPGSGEIDIMESSVNKWGSNNVYGTLHCTAGSGGSPVFTEAKTVTFSDGNFHKYAVDWDDDHIDWYYDDVKVFSYNPSSYEQAPWPFKQEFYIILNLAVGGNLGGAVPEDFTSSTMEVDYVRVWQKDAGYTDRSVEVTGAPESTVAKSIPSGAKVVYDSSAAITNPVTNFYDVWNGGWTTADYTAGSDAIKRVVFSSMVGGNACGAWDIAGYAYGANAKLHLSVYAAQNFSIKPVKPDTAFDQTVSKAGTAEWVDVEIDLGAANTLSQIGFVSTVVQNIWVDHVYITESDSGSGGSGESGSGGTGGEGGEGGEATSIEDGLSIKLKTAVGGAWIHLVAEWTDAAYAVTNASLVTETEYQPLIDTSNNYTGLVGEYSSTGSSGTWGVNFKNAEFLSATNHTLVFYLDVNSKRYKVTVSFVGKNSTSDEEFTINSVTYEEVN